MSNEDDEWSLLSESYQNILLPRFQSLYDFLGKVILNFIEINQQKKCWKILDFGTGPGEPLLTIVRCLNEKKENVIEYKGIDSSTKMISLAKDRLSKMDLNSSNVEFVHSNKFSDFHSNDFIVDCFVLPYLNNQQEFVRQSYENLNENGLLISCVWSNAQNVKYLSLIKILNKFMFENKNISVFELEDDISFSCANKQTVEQLFQQEKFSIKQVIDFTLRFTFEDIRSLLRFCENTSWFQDKNLYLKAENQTKSILNELFNYPSDFSGPFHFNDLVHIFIVSK